MKNGFWVLCIVLLSVSGCSREEPAEESAKVSGSGVPDDNVFSDQVKALEKAESVQNVLDDAAAKQRDTLEKQE